MIQMAQTEPWTQPETTSAATQETKETEVTHETQLQGTQVARVTQHSHPPERGWVAAITSFSAATATAASAASAASAADDVATAYAAAAASASTATAASSVVVDAADLECTVCLNLPESIVYQVCRRATCTEHQPPTTPKNHQQTNYPHDHRRNQHTKRPDLVPAHPLTVLPPTYHSVHLRAHHMRRVPTAPPDERPIQCVVQLPHVPHRIRS